VLEQQLPAELRHDLLEQLYALLVEATAVSWLAAAD